MLFHIVQASEYWIGYAECVKACPLGSCLPAQSGPRHRLASIFLGLELVGWEVQLGVDFLAVVSLDARLSR
ncbi:hypothetical protein ACWEPN_06575, partial [Nonomuraea wenchangensis]